MAATTLSTSWTASDVYPFKVASDATAWYGKIVEADTTSGPGYASLAGADSEKALGVVVENAETTATDGTAYVGVVFIGSGRVVEVEQSATVGDGIQIGIAASGEAKGDPGDGKAVIGLSLTDAADGEYQLVALGLGVTIGV